MITMTRRNRGMLQCVYFYIYYLFDNQAVRKLKMDESGRKSFTPSFLGWMNKNGSVDTPVALGNSYLNLENPLQFNRDQNIQNISNQLQNCRVELGQEKQKVLQFSKSLYKKVVSRDAVNYCFGNAFIEETNRSTIKYQNQLQKNKEKKSSESTQRQKIKREELAKEFLHGEQLAQKTPHEGPSQQITLALIKEIGMPQFGQKYKGTNFYNLLAPKGPQEKYINPYDDISEDYEIQQLIFKLKFPIIQHDNMYGPRSDGLMWKTDEEMDFWRRSDPLFEDNRDEISIIKRCQNFSQYSPTALHLLDYCSGRIDGEILNQYYKIKKQHDAELKLDENDENLEEEYKKKKEEYEFLREISKRDNTQKIAVKQVRNATQTIDAMEQDSFDSYFEQNTKDLLNQLKEANQMRDLIIERKPHNHEAKVMLTNIGYQVKDLLLRLLCRIFKDETFPEYQKYIELEDKKVAEKKILELIYHSFKQIKTLEVDGVSKEQIIAIYLQEREKNDKIFELVGRMYPEVKPKRKP